MEAIFIGVVNRELEEAEAEAKEEAEAEAKEEAEVKVEGVRSSGDEGKEEGSSEDEGRIWKDRQETKCRVECN